MGATFQLKMAANVQKPVINDTMNTQTAIYLFTEPKSNQKDKDMINIKFHIGALNVKCQKVPSWILKWPPIYKNT